MNVRRDRLFVTFFGGAQLLRVFTSSTRAEMGCVFSLLVFSRILASKVFYRW